MAAYTEMASHRAAQSLECMQTVEILQPLPPELCLRICSTLEADDLAMCSLVCKAWNSFFSCNQLWERLYRQDLEDVEKENSDDNKENADSSLVKRKAEPVLNWKKEYARNVRRKRFGRYVTTPRYCS